MVGIAQLAEQQVVGLEAGGSNPFIYPYDPFLLS